MAKKLFENKKIKAIKLPNRGTFLRKQWEDNFAGHLSPEEKEEIYLCDYCGYLWHLFSYGKKHCLREQEAEKAFDNEPKNSCYIFWQHADYALIVENTDILNHNDLENEYDIYITDKEFNWTYVKTHETGLCGPYFSRKSKKGSIEIIERTERNL